VTGHGSRIVELARDVTGQEGRVQRALHDIKDLEAKSDSMAVELGREL